MGTFPTKQARQELGFTPSTAVRANIDVRSGEQALGPKLAQGISAIKGESDKRSARELAIEEKNRKNLDDITADLADKSRAVRGVAIKEMQAERPPEEWKDRTRQMVIDETGSRSDLSFSPEEAFKQEMIDKTDLINEPKLSFIAASRRLSAEAVKTQKANLVETIRLNGKGVEASRQATEFIKTYKNNGLSASQTMLDLKAAQELGLEERTKDIVSNIKIKAMNPIYNKEVRAEFFDEARSIMQASSVTSEDKLAEIQSINLFEQQLIRKDERDRFASNVDTTSGFTEQIENETLTLNAVRAAYPTTSKDDKNNVKLWQERIRGSLKPAPTKTTGKGAKTVSDVMLQISTGEKDALSAYNDILNARYIDQSIDQQTFDLAIKRINSPYDKYLADIINNTLSEKEAVITAKENSLFFTGAERKIVQEKIEQTTIQLFEWIDKELEINPKKVFTPKEINNMQAQVSVTAETPSTGKPLTEKEEARRQELIRKKNR